MRFPVREALGFALLIFFAIPQQIYSQQAPATSLSATTTLQRSLGALAPNLAVTDVTLTGSVRRIAGSDDETGSATLKALSSGAARADLSLSSGTFSEIYNSPASGPVGAWSGPDGTFHTIPLHNLLSEPAWFFPTFAISRRLAAGYVVTDLGPETRDGQLVEHFAIVRAADPTIQKDLTSIWAHLSQIEIYVDISSSLPKAVAFDVHPDNNLMIDIPVEIKFSDYRVVSGVQVPYRVQKFINNSLSLELTIENVVINAGLTASEFTTN